MLLSFDINAQCDHPDYEALIELYDETDGSNWSANFGWTEGKDGESCDPCNFNGSTWNGITCSDGRVKILDLAVSNLNGTIPNLEFDSLDVLLLGGNQLKGSLPNFDKMPQLRTLSIENNQLSGQLPSFEFLPNLQYLRGFNNNFTGTLPDFKNSTELITLRLELNSFEGDVPNFKLPFLKSLDLSNNALEGGIPGFSECQSLQEIFLAYNNLEGPIPDFNLPNLFYLVLESNRIQGRLPSFENLESLQVVSVRNNKLSGHLPDFDYQVSTGQFFLRAGVNRFTGCYPPSICDITFAELDANYALPYFGDVAKFCNGADEVGAPCGQFFDWGIHGEILEDCSCFIPECEEPHPDYEMLMSLFRDLDGENWLGAGPWRSAAQGFHCDPCNFIEIIPTWPYIACDSLDRVVCIDFDGIGDCSNVGSGGIGLSGTLPTIASEHLTTLILDDNVIYGPLPDLSGLPNLKTFWSRNTSIEGEIPALSSLKFLEEFRVSFNELTGPVPDLSQNENLKSFSAYDNNLSGCFPDIVCALELFDTRENPEMPWSGDHLAFCNGASELGAPCTIQDSIETGQGSGEAGFIDEHCMCAILSPVSHPFENKINIFPNPTHHRINLKDGFDCKSYSIMNTDGKLIQKAFLTSQQIDIQSLMRGTYLLLLELKNGEREVLKFVKI